MYVVDRDRQIMLIQEMTQLRKDTENWVVYYHHPTTNDMWKSYFPRAHGGELGPKILRVEPAPEPVDELVDRCLHSDAADDAIGLGLELSVEPSRWEDAINFLEDHYHLYARDQVRTFFRFLGVNSYKDLFEEIEYVPEPDGLDMKHFDALRKRARMIRMKRFFYLF